MLAIGWLEHMEAPMHIVRMQLTLCITIVASKNVNSLTLCTHGPTRQDAAKRAYTHARAASEVRSSSWAIACWPRVWISKGSHLLLCARLEDEVLLKTI